MRRMSLYGLKQVKILKCDEKLTIKYKMETSYCASMSHALEKLHYSNPNTKMITPGAQTKYW